MLSIFSSCKRNNWCNLEMPCSGLQLEPGKSIHGWQESILLFAKKNLAEILLFIDYLQPLRINIQYNWRWHNNHNAKNLFEYQASAKKRSWKFRRCSPAHPVELFSHLQVGLLYSPTVPCVYEKGNLASTKSKKYLLRRRSQWKKQRKRCWFSPSDTGQRMITNRSIARIAHFHEFWSKSRY